MKYNSYYFVDCESAHVWLHNRRVQKENTGNNFFCTEMHEASGGKVKKEKGSTHI